MKDLGAYGREVIPDGVSGKTSCGTGTAAEVGGSGVGSVEGGVGFQVEGKACAKIL